LFEETGGKGISYSLSGANAGNFTILDTHAKYTLKSDVDLETFTLDEFFDGVTAAFTNIQSRSVGNTYLTITAGRPKGYEPNVPVTLNAVIKKGSTVINKSYDLVFDRPLSNSKVAHLDVGEPLKSYAGGTAGFKTYIENKGASKETVLAVIAMYDTSGNLYKAKVGNVEITPGNGALSDVSVTLTGDEQANVETVNYYLWIDGTYKPVLIKN
jgi:hypothetical protein